MTQKFETRAIHAGQEPEPAYGAVCTPVYMTSTFAQSAPGVHKGYDYSRADNPTRTALEQNLASLENAKHGICFASGCAATAAVIHYLGADSHIISMDDVYGGTRRLFSQVFTEAARSFDFIDLSQPSLIEAHIRPNTKAVWIETPTNPLMKLVDIEAVVAIAKKHGLLVIVDNTFMSPYFQQPLSLGADIVVHSCTKYLGGHSDVVMGVAVTNDDEIGERLHFIQKSVGATPGPMDCFLVLRGTKTLAVRMKQHDENGRQVAAWLAAHPRVERVIYPGLESHPQHQLAVRQMSGFGGMMSFVVKGGLEAATQMLERCRIFTLAESLGGVESLIEHPAIMTHASVPAEIRQELGIEDGLIRISTGIEHIDDLITDLEAALS
ncbi:MAG: cystathionine gamma-synthase [Bradymonadia bacterium]